MEERFQDLLEVLRFAKILYVNLERCCHECMLVLALAPLQRQHLSQEFEAETVECWYVAWEDLI